MFVPVNQYEINMKTNTSMLKVTFLILIFLVFVTSCNHSPEYVDENTSIPIESTGETPAFKSVTNTLENNEPKQIQEQVKIIRNASLRMEVKDIEEATRIARRYTSQYAGYVSDERMKNTYYSKENRFTIRVPQEYFDVLMDSISSLSNQIDSKNVSTIDVTEEYVDIQSRLLTKREVKKRYEDILRSKAKTVKEVLQAEEKIRILQEEIEVAEGRLRYMTTNVSYSTIQIDVYETIPETDDSRDEKPSFWEEIKDSLRFGLSLIEGVVLFLLHIWPITIIALTLGVSIFRKRKSRRK